MDRNFEILNIEHVAIAVNDISSSKLIFEEVLGMNSSEVENVANEKVNVIKISPKNTVSKIELIEPSDTLSPISKFLEKKGQGMHHIAFYVDDTVSYTHLTLPTICSV